MKKWRLTPPLPSPPLRREVLLESTDAHVTEKTVKIPLSLAILPCVSCLGGLGILGKRKAITGSKKGNRQIKKQKKERHASFRYVI